MHQQQTERRKSCRNGDGSYTERDSVSCHVFCEVFRGGTSLEGRRWGFMYIYIYSWSQCQARISPWHSPSPLFFSPLCPFLNAFPLLIFFLFLFFLYLFLCYCGLCFFHFLLFFSFSVSVYSFFFILPSLSSNFASPLLSYFCFGILFHPDFSPLFLFCSPSSISLSFSQFLLLPLFSSPSPSSIPFFSSQSLLPLFPSSSPSLSFFLYSLLLLVFSPSLSFPLVLPHFSYSTFRFRLLVHSLHSSRPKNILANLTKVDYL